MHLLCPHCKNPIELVKIDVTAEITCAACGSTFRLEDGSTTGWVEPAAQTVGRFTILETLGHGAFGTVFKAKDPELDRIIALKVPRRGNIGDAPKDVERFLREARSSAQLRHANIVSIHEVGTQDGRPYLVSDLVEGVTLADSLTARRPAPREAAKIAAEVADALQHAHSLGVVHRDVKPSNIMVRPDGSPVVMDFGLAKRDAGEITMTMEGQVLGTPAYMSPEQARGEGHRVDGRSDIYSVGVVLYQLLTGELPFRGNTRMLLHQVLHEEPKPPRSLNDKIPRDLEKVCLKAMAKESGRRYATAGELAADLRRFLAGEPVRARAIGSVERALRWARRKPMAATAAVLGVLTLAAVVAAGVGFAYSEKLSGAYMGEVKAREEAEAAQVAEEEQRKLADTARRAAEVSEVKAHDALTKMEQIEYLNSILIAGTAIKEGRDKDALAALESCKKELRAWEWHELYAASHREHLAVNGITMAFRPAHDQIACAERDGTIRIWDLVTGKEVGAAPLATGGPIASLAYSPDGRWLTGAGPKGLRVWETDGLREAWKADGWYGKLAFSQDGRWLAASGPEVMRVWETDGGKELGKADGSYSAVTFSPDGRRLAVAGSRVLRMLDVEGWRELWNADAGSVGLFTAVEFSPDGRRLAAAGLLVGVRLWEADGGRELWKSPGEYYALKFSPDGRRLAGGGLKGKCLWDADGGRDLWKSEGTYGPGSLAFSPDGRVLATAGLQGARLWQADIGRETWKGDGAFDTVAFSTDGRRLAAVGQRGVRVWEVEGGRELWRAEGKYRGVLFSPDGRRLATAGVSGMQLWEADRGRELWKANGSYEKMAFSPDGKLLAAPSSGEVRLWETEGGHELWRAKGAANGGYVNVTFSPDGRLVAAADAKGVQVWEAISGRDSRKNAGNYWNIAFSPDGRKLAATGAQGVQVWNIDGGGEIWKADGEYSWLVFGRNQLQAVGNLGLRSWQADTGTELWKADGFHLTVGWSRDARLLAAAGVPGLLVWEADKGRELWKTDGAFTALAFTPDGGRLATAEPLSSRVRVWLADGGREIWKADGAYQATAFSSDGRLALAGSEGVRVLSGLTDSLSLLETRRAAVQSNRKRWHEAAAAQCEGQNEWFAAAFHWERIALIEPTLGQPHYRRGLSLAHLGRTADSDREFKTALEHRDTLPPFVVADCFAMLGEWQEAAKVYQQLIETTPRVEDSTLRRNALVQLGGGNLAGYRAACKTTFNKFGKTKVGPSAYDLAWSFAIGPDALADLKPAVELARVAVKANPTDADVHNTHGAILYRAGDYANAVTELNTSIQLRPKGGTWSNYLFLAMAQHRLGKADEARKSLEQAEQILNQDPQWHWVDKLERQLLRREATELIRPAPPAKK